MKFKVNLIIFILSLLLLTSCNNTFGIWIRSITNNEEITTSLNKKLVPYEKQFYIDFYIDKDVGDQVKIRNILTSNLNRVYKLIDNNNNYHVESSNEDKQLLNNVKVINDSINKTVLIDDELFYLLNFAKQNSINSNSYSLFSGSLNKFWLDNFKYYNDNSSLSLDPYFNNESKAKLDKIVSCIPKTNEAIDEMLILDEGEKSVIYKVNEDCVQEGITPFIDLYNLSLAYLGDKIKEELIMNSYKQGLIYVGGNMVVTLAKSPVDKWSFALRDPRVKITSKGAKVIASVTLEEKFNAITIDDFPIDKNYKFIDHKNEKVIYRHPHINPLTGYPNNVIRSIVGVSYEQNTLLDLYFTTLKLFNIVNQQDIITNRPSIIDIIYTHQTGIDDDSICEADKWCPTTPSKLYLKSNTSFNNRLNYTNDVIYEKIN